MSSASHAEVYKWVDENGQTHYSENKEDAAKAKTVELKVKSLPTSPQATNSPPKYWQEQEKLIQIQVQKPNEKSYVPPVTTGPKSISGGKSDETDTGKCNLARDVISGAVKHRNGAPIDDYDREVAENDIRAFCQ